MIMVIVIMFLLILCCVVGACDDLKLSFVRANEKQ